MQPQKSLRPFPTVSPGRIHLAALLHVVDRLEPDGGQSAAGERREEEEDDKQGVASRVTNTRGGYGWAAASFHVGDSPHLALDGDGAARSSERVAARGVPCGAGRDALPAALAAAETSAGVERDLVALIILLVGGCASYQTVLRNKNGETITCEASGKSGIITGYYLKEGFELLR